jgi:SAM-dependent methyltransferase
MNVGDLAPAPWLRAALAAFAEDVRALGPVLDVGCGPGTVTAHLAGLGVDVSGVDLSPRMIAHARRLHPALRFAVASATDLDLAEASLAGVLGWWSLFNLPRKVLPDVLASFARALVPGRAPPAGNARRRRRHPAHRGLRHAGHLDDPSVAAPATGRPAFPGRPPAGCRAAAAADSCGSIGSRLPGPGGPRRSAAELTSTPDWLDHRSRCGDGGCDLRPVPKGGLRDTRDRVDSLCWEPASAVGVGEPCRRGRRSC